MSADMCFFANLVRFAYRLNCDDGTGEQIMKSARVACGIAVAAAIILVAGEGAAGADRAMSTSSREMYRDLRSMALGMKAETVGASSNAQAYGIVMDIDVDGATATITSFSSGDASLYISTGGGTIGSGPHKSVASAARAFVETGAGELPRMTLTQMYPVPSRGQVTFYVLTPKGAYMASGSEEEMGEGRHPLSKLFYAGQAVLTEIRRIDERR